MLWFFLTLPVLLQRRCLTCHCVHSLTPRANRARPESRIHLKIFKKTQYLINTLYLIEVTFARCLLLGARRVNSPSRGKSGCFQSPPTSSWSRSKPRSSSSHTTPTISTRMGQLNVIMLATKTSIDAKNILTNRRPYWNTELKRSVGRSVGRSRWSLF